MKKKLLVLLAVTSTCFALPVPELPSKEVIVTKVNTVMSQLFSLISTKLQYPLGPIESLSEVKGILKAEASTLNPAVIDKVLTTLKCANEYKIEHNSVLAIIDYSLPSSEKRLWVFDLNAKKLLFHTYVSHGIKSGELLSTYFSNKNNSKASSMGVFKTEKPYYGRHGLALQLDGLDRGFNDNASSRAVVMHGGWYVDEGFIKKYGRAGRSWGCPAVPSDLTEPIIHAIQNNAMVVMYYPNDDWLVKSRFQNCAIVPPRQAARLDAGTQPLTAVNEIREDVLFAYLNKKNKHEENEAVVAMPADEYTRVFNTKVPLNRMLRRQINNMEYIALSNNEFKKIATLGKDNLSVVNFVVPVIHMVRGYYATEMKIVSMGAIKDVGFNTSSSKTMDQVNSYTVHFDSNATLGVKSTSQFIRWLGL